MCFLCSYKVYAKYIFLNIHEYYTELYMYVYISVSVRITLSRVKYLCIKCIIYHRFQFYLYNSTLIRFLTFL